MDTRTEHTAPGRVPRIVAIAVALFGIQAAPPAHAAWPHDPYAGNVPLCLAAGYRESPQACEDAAGGMIVVWQDDRTVGLGTDLYAQRITANGEPLWATNGVAVRAAIGAQVGVDIAPDGAGGAIVVWQDDGGGTYDIVAQRISAGGQLMWGAQGVPVCAAANHQRDPRVVSDGAGGALIAWKDLRNGAHDDVYVQRVNAGGTTQWTTDGVLVCGAAGTQSRINLVHDATGGAIVSWQDGRTANTAIYAQRVSAGAAVWAANGVPLCTGAFMAYDPVIAADMQGGAIVAWEDLRAGVSTYSVYAQRVSAAGVGQWTLNGVPLSSTTGDLSSLTIDSDGTGGIVAAWDFANVTSGYDVYAQRLNAGGAREWGAAGIGVFAQSQNQYLGDIVADGQGGAYLTAVDYTSGFTGDLVAHHISGQGELRWESDAVPVSAAALNQHSPTMVLGTPGLTDSRRPMLVAWADERTAPATHIYAQRVGFEGELGDATPTITSVRDVPNDQGGALRVAWAASHLDVGPESQNLYYYLWRSVPLAAVSRESSLRNRGVTRDAAEARQSGRVWLQSAASTTWAWEYVSGISAASAPNYSLTVVTTGDSLPGSNPHTVFMVQAYRATGSPPSVWYSAPDSGYSVDDLAPAPPAPFAGTYNAGTTRLTWNPNREPDLAGYRVHRGVTPGFVPNVATLFSTQGDTGYVEHAGAPFVYKVVAVDIHGNESAPATFVPAATVDAPRTVAGAVFLAAPTPNPARGVTRVRFTLPRGGAVKLAMFDAAGRRVRALWDGAADAGEHVVPFALADDDGRPLPSGLYLVRLESGGEVRSRRVMAVR